MQKFASDGTFLGQWGSTGSEPGQFQGPYSLTTDAAGNVYVADSDNDRIQKFTNDGDFISEWGEEGSEPGQLDWPAGIAVDEDGDVYVTELENDRVQKFSADGEPLGRWGSAGTGEGEFSNPYDIDFDSNGNVYVADADNDRVQKFTPDGDFLEEWGSEGIGNGEFQIVQDLTIVGDSIFVLDNSDRVQRLTLDGEFISRFGGSGAGDAQFVSGRSIDADCRGNLYVVDEIAGRVSVFGDPGAPPPPCTPVALPPPPPTPPAAGSPAPLSKRLTPLLRARKRQSLRRIFVRMGCGTPCRIRVTGRLIARKGPPGLRRAAGRVALKPVTRRLGDESGTRIRLRFKKRAPALRTLARALRRGAVLSLRVTLAARADGRRASRSLAISLKR